MRMRRGFGRRVWSPGFGLAIGLIVLWILSITSWISFGRPTWNVVFHGGVMVYQSFPDHLQMGYPLGWTVATGVSWNPGQLKIQNANSPSLRIIVLPLWMPMAMCTLMASVVWHFRVRIDRASACSACGYDCTGVPDGAVCPECGKARERSA